ncbi:MAG: hypothetical protein HRU10_14805 [Opitutales bacterium]|nr:hypothetical protein [Opitutales bacterium]
MQTTSPIEHHLELSQQIHQLLLEENSFLKAEQRAPDADFLEKKRSLLEAFTQSLEAIRSWRAALPQLSDTQREQVCAAQNRVMQTLYLDRENEQLLLKYSVSSQVPTLHRAATPERVKDAYSS